MSKKKPPKSPTARADFASSFDWSPEFQITWHGFVGLHALDSDRVVKIELLESSQSVGSVRVTVLNKKTGPVDATVFSFTDHLSADMKDRTDDRSDFERTPSAWCGHGRHGWEWYIAVPKTTRPLCAAIEEHVRFFR